MGKQLAATKAWKIAMYSCTSQIPEGYGCTQPQNAIVLHEEEANGHTQGVKWKPFMSTFGQKPYCCPWVASGRLRTCQFSCLAEVVLTIFILYYYLLWPHFCMKFDRTLSYHNSKKSWTAAFYRGGSAHVTPAAAFAATAEKSRTIQSIATTWTTKYATTSAIQW